MKGVNPKFKDVRRNLLILMSKELNNQKKFCKTRINSRSLSKAEEYFSVQNDQFIKLKTEIFSSSRLSLTESLFGEKQVTKSVVCSSSCNNNLLKIPLQKCCSLSVKTNDSESNISSHNGSQIFSDDIFKLPHNKTSVSQRKNEFFRQKTLNMLGSENQNIEDNENSNIIIINGNYNLLEEEKIFSNAKKDIINRIPLSEIDKKIDMINNRSRIHNKSTKRRTKQGFSYLQKLSFKLKKKARKKNSMTSLFIEINEMLNINADKKLFDEEYNDKFNAEEKNNEKSDTNVLIVINYENNNESWREGNTFEESYNNLSHMTNKNKEKISCDLKRLSHKTIKCDKLLKLKPIDIPDYNRKTLNKSFEYDASSEFAIKLNLCDKR